MQVIILCDIPLLPAVVANAKRHELPLSFPFLSLFSNKAWIITDLLANNNCVKFILHVLAGIYAMEGGATSKILHTPKEFFL